MGKGEFPETNRDARERQTWRLGLDWCKCAVAGHVKPAPTIASIKRPGWKPALTGNRSLSSLQLGASALSPLLPRITKSDRGITRLRIGRVPLRPRSLPRI